MRPFVNAFVRYAAATGAGAAAGALVGPARQGRRTERWYRSLDTPPFSPPDAVFAPVWTGLYALSAASAARVRTAESDVDSDDRRRALRWWWTQTALNAAWTPLFFGARRPRLALVDLAALVVALGAYARAAQRVDATAAAMVVPYLGWTGFALVLNAEIVRRN